MKGGRKIMDTATAATLGATAITLAWFIRDMKRENTKVLKRIEQGQERGFTKMAEIQEQGFKALSNDSAQIAKILERIDSNTRTR